MSEHLEYVSRQVKNRETFLLNYGNDFRIFDLHVRALRSVWSRLAQRRDTSGGSHAGLLVFANILVRHSILGFQQLASYQSYLSWLTFRPGLEALLILGKLVDDPANATIWRQRETNRTAYERTFSGPGLLSTSLPRSAEFRQVLSRLNDQFMHPNPDFAYRDTTIRDEGPTVAVAIQFFDVRAEIHEAHLLAYLNLLDTIVSASERLINGLLGSQFEIEGGRETLAISQAPRATRLATRDPLARTIMEELGLWHF